MADSVIPGSDEQAKKALRGSGGFLKKTFGTIPEDIVGLLAGDWLKVRRAENLARTAEKAKEHLKARGVETSEPASLSLTLPIFVAAAEESRDELQDLWARLLAAAADPSRVSLLRIRFIEAAKKMDPLDAHVLSQVRSQGGRVASTGLNALAAELGVTRDQIDVSCENLRELGLLMGDLHSALLSSLGREFLRVVSD